jgi:hypothetical protein
MGGYSHHEDVDRILGLQHEAMAFIKSPGGASLQYVQAEGPLVHGRCHDMPEYGTPQPFTLMCRGHVEVFNPPRIWLRADRNDPGIHTARMDHVGVLRLEAVEEALADTDGIESPEPFQIRTHHHRAELGDPRGVGSYTGTEDEVSHANKPMVRWLPVYSSSVMFPDQAGTAPVKCSGGFLV